MDDQQHALAEWQQIEAFQHADHGFRRLQTARVHHQMELGVCARSAHRSSSRQTMSGWPHTTGPSE